MSFWIIFLCLLTGAVIGYEFGRYTVSRKINIVLDEAIANMKTAAENLRRKKELEEAQKQNKAESIDILNSKERKNE